MWFIAKPKPIILMYWIFIKTFLCNPKTKLPTIKQTTFGRTTLTTSQELDRATERADKAAAELRRTQAELRVTQVPPVFFRFNSNQPQFYFRIRIFLYVFELFSIFFVSTLKPYFLSFISQITFNIYLWRYIYVLK